MRFYWLRDHVAQGQFQVYWAPGKTNLADYFTKHHSPAHHKLLRPIYLHANTSPTDLQGYIKILSAQPSSAQHKSIRPAHGQTDGQSSYTSAAKLLNTVKALAK